MKKILVVDDEKELLDILESVLSDEGYQVIVLSSSSQVKKTIEREQPYVVLMDVFLPGENGDRVMRKLKKDLLRETPSILMSADDSLYDRQKKSGADAAIKKPFSIEELLQAIEKSTARIKRS